jgi:hypothetical protein
MAYTDQQATDELCKHFSTRTSKAIVAQIGAKAVFEGAGAAMSDSGKAQKHVESFGHSPDAAAKIVKRVGTHVVLAHQQLNPDTDSSFWDPRFGESDTRDKGQTQGQKKGPSDKQ